ncbi:MAG TPA: family 1 glycosylhydrolase [Chlamydiales bacterium]|nr:family 1 glycosylhydrolase [Chlamydiales bacterium]
MGSLGLRLEKTLLPPPDVVKWNQGAIEPVKLSVAKKIQHFVVNLFLLIGNLLSIPFLAAYSAARYVVMKVASLCKKSPPQDNVVPLPDSDLAGGLPPHFGTADSFFQTGGLGTDASATPLEGRSNWNERLNPAHIEGTEDRDYKKFFVDVLGNPGPYIQLLKEMGQTAHRFSLEWSVIEPEKGRYDLEAIRLYKQFIQALIAAGITPYVTLHHFVSPKWLEPISKSLPKSAFDNPKVVDEFVRHSLAMMEEFPEVTHWMTFNEPGVLGMQSCLMGDYPPGLKGDYAANGRVIRNLLAAHCKVYQEAKAKYGDLKQIGITHQWLKFLPLEGNPTEKMLSHHFSKNHNAIYEFFKTGNFSLQAAGKANVQFSIPKEEFEQNGKFMDFLGVQTYGFPRLKAGFNGGKVHPGYKTINIPLLGKWGMAFGSSCRPGEKMMSFGPRYTPADFEVCLKEAADLGRPMVISETGCDARIQKFGDKEFKIDDETQRDYFEKILPVLKKFQGRIIAFFAWTLLRGHLEWNRGNFPRLGLVDVVKVDQKIQSYQLSPAAKLLQRVFHERMRQPAVQVA